MTDEAPTTEQAEEAPRKSFSLLASEHFGNNYHGEVREPEPETPENEEGEAPEVEPEAEAPQEETEEAESLEASESSEEDEGVPISSVNELIEHNEYDPEWFNSLKVPVKVNGEQSEATLSDLVKSYQMTEAAEKRLEEAKSKAKTQTQELAQQSEAVQAQYATAAKLIEKAEGLLDQDSKSIDWKSLREDDPAEYSAKKAEFAERRQEIEQMKDEARQEYQNFAHSSQEQRQEAWNQYVLEQRDKLLEKVPEWQDPEKAKAEDAKLTEYLLSQGFSKEEIQAASDHRVVLLARKAWLHDNAQAGTDAAKKKVAKIPKVMKPGAPKPQEQKQKEQADKLRSKVKASGSIEDAYAYLKSRRK